MREGQAEVPGDGEKALCIFCDQPNKLTREHVIPRALGPTLLKSRAPTGQAPGGKLMTFRFNPGPGDDSEPREWSNDELDLITKSVCEECNTASRSCNQPLRLDLF